MTRRAEMIYWITEREAMRQRKEAGPPTLAHGYSMDPAMGRVRYCNVHREDDKVTKWIADYWRDSEMPVWWMVLGRMVNYIPTLEEIQLEVGCGPMGTDQWLYPSLETISRIMKTRRAQGEKVWTAAYTISTAGQAVDKVDYVLGVVGAAAKITPVQRAVDPSWPTLAHAHAYLCAVKGLGSFLAAQVVADLKNTKGWGLDPESTRDWWSWSSYGPGSLRGLQAYFQADVTPRTYQAHIERCWDEVKDSVPRMHMQDFQNCLCEFSKYMRVKEGDGRVRNTYTPR